MHKTLKYYQIFKLFEFWSVQVKGVKPEDLALRPDLALALSGKVEEIPDGVAVGRMKNVAKGSDVEIKIDYISTGWQL